MSGVLRSAVGPVLRASTSGAFTPGAAAANPLTVTGAYSAVIGDSIDAIGVNSWFDESCRATGQRMRYYANKGTAGNTTAQMVARITADIVNLSPRPTVCVIGGPTNDIGQGISLATTQANIQSMVATLRAAGIVPIMRNCPSNNNAGTGIYNTVALRRQAVLDYNAWLATYCASEGIPILDIFTPTYDGTGLNTSYTADGTHFNGAGCIAAAEYVAANLPSILNTAARPYLTSASSDPLNLIVNGIFVGDSNADGIANGWFTGGVTSPSLTANDVDGVGNWQNFTTTNGASANIAITPRSPATAGNVLEFAALAKGVVGKVIKLRMQFFDALSGGNNLGALDLLPTDWTTLSTVPRTLFYRATAPANTLSVQVFVQGTSTGVTGQMSVARATIRDKTTNP